MQIATQLLAGVFVIGLLATALWMLRRSGALHTRLRSRSGRVERRLESLERLPLSPQVTLHLVRVDDRTVLVGLHSAGCSLLETRPGDPPAARLDSPACVRGTTA